jgi:hypothetical protein
MIPSPSESPRRGSRVAGDTYFTRRPASNSPPSGALRLTDIHPDPSVPRPLWLRAGSIIGPIVPCGRGGRPTPTPVTVPTPASTAPTTPRPSPCIPTPFPPGAGGLRADAAEAFLAGTSGAHFGSGAAQTETYANESGDCRNDHLTQHNLLPELPRL